MAWYKLVTHNEHIAQLLPHCGKPKPLAEHPGMSCFEWEASKIPSALLAIIHRANRLSQTCFYWELKPYRAVFFDMDSTVIAEESIVELARFAGTAEEVERITELAMAGKLDFNQALKQRVATLQGQDESILEKVSQSLTINQGMLEAARHAVKLKISLYLISGGFHELARHIAKQLCFDDFRANYLERENGQLTGHVAGTIINATEKLRFVKQVCLEKSLSPETVIAIGDGANDLPMLSYAGLALGYRPKEVLIPHLNGAIFDSFTILKLVFADLAP